MVTIPLNHKARTDLMFTLHALQNNVIFDQRRECFFFFPTIGDIPAAHFSDCATALASLFKPERYVHFLFGLYWTQNCILCAAHTIQYTVLESSAPP